MLTPEGALFKVVHNSIPIQSHLRGSLEARQDVSESETKGHRWVFVLQFSEVFSLTLPNHAMLDMHPERHEFHVIVSPQSA
jgi:hypothetical protein